MIGWLKARLTGMRCSSAKESPEICGTTRVDGSLCAAIRAEREAFRHDYSTSAVSCTVSGMRTGTLSGPLRRCPSGCRAHSDLENRRWTMSPTVLQSPLQVSFGMNPKSSSQCAALVVRNSIGFNVTCQPGSASAAKRLRSSRPSFPPKSTPSSSLVNTSPEIGPS